MDMKLSARKLDKMIEEATVDCYDELEQASGFYTMIEDHLAVPFATQVLGVEVWLVLKWMITEASKQCANATENGNSSGSLTWNCPSLRHPAPSGLLPIGAGSAAGRPGGRARQNRTLTHDLLMGAVLPGLFAPTGVPRCEEVRQLTAAKGVAQHAERPRRVAEASCRFG